MTNYFLIGLLLISQLPGYHPELLPRPLQDVKISGEMSLVKEGYFIYRYKVYNPAQNNGRLIWFDIDVKKGEGIVAPGTEGLPSNDKCASNITRMVKSGTVIPVGMDSPLNWFCSIGTDGMGGWASKAHDNDILPGQTRSGFVMTSYGLPTIKDIIVRPLIVSSVYPNIEEFDVDMDELKKVQLTDRYKVSFHSKTVGPTAPPADFKPLAFFEYIIDLKHRAVSLGWITNDGIVNSLDAKLANAKKKLTEGSPGAAKNILNAFISEVEAQGCATYENCPSGKHLTSEAYALLKYNAQYLIDHL